MVVPLNQSAALDLPSILLDFIDSLGCELAKSKLRFYNQALKVRNDLAFLCPFREGLCDPHLVSP